MPKSKNQKLKLYYIIEYFKKYTDEEHSVSVADIIDYLATMGIAAERKSIYRDIQAIEELGYEIITVHDKRYTYYLADRIFENAELRTLADAVAASRFITRKKSQDLIRKLESLTTVYDAEKLNSQVFVANRIKTENESIYYNVDAIHNAIFDDSRISFLYFDWDINGHKVYRHNEKIYDVSPWALAWNNENYYLIAYDSEKSELRHYRVDRMMSIMPLGLPREGRERFRNADTAQYTKKFFGMYDGEMESVTLNCSNDVVNAVIDMFGTGNEFIPDLDGESFNVTVELAVSPVFLSWVFMFGGKVKIVSPQHICDKLVDMAQNVINGYDRKGI